MERRGKRDSPRRRAQRPAPPRAGRSTAPRPSTTAFRRPGSPAAPATLATERRSRGRRAAASRRAVAPEIRSTMFVIHAGSAGRSGAIVAAGNSRAKVGLELLSRVAELHGADALAGRGDEQPPERAAHGREPDREARSAATVRRRRHATTGGRCFVDAARRTVAGLVKRAAHIVPVTKRAAEAARPAGRLVLARRNAEHTLEFPLEMRRAEFRQAREDGQRHGLIGVRRQVRRRRCDRVRGGRSCRATGMTSAAGAEPALLGGAGRREEPHVLAPRPPARTTRPAIDAGRRDRVDELAVGDGIARQHRRPQSLVASLWLFHPPHPPPLAPRQPHPPCPAHLPYLPLIVQHAPTVRHRESRGDPAFAAEFRGAFAGGLRRSGISADYADYADSLWVVPSTHPR